MNQPEGPDPTPAQGRAAAPSIFGWAQPQPAAQSEATSLSSELQVQQRSLELELAAARAELSTLHQLVEEIPRIYEQKVQQRLTQILEENAYLRRQLEQLHKVIPSPAPALRQQLSPSSTGWSWRSLLRHPFSLGRGRRALIGPRDGNASHGQNSD